MDVVDIKDARPSLEEQSPIVRSLIENLLQKHKGYEFVKVGPKGQARKEDKSSVTLYNPETKLFLKAFPVTFKEIGKREIQLTLLFNLFSKEKKSSFSGPTPVIYSTSDDEGKGGNMIITEDEEENAFLMVNFVGKSIDELTNFYKLYREEFDKFDNFIENPAESVESEVQELSPFSSFNKEEFISQAKEKREEQINRWIDVGGENGEGNKAINIKGLLGESYISEHMPFLQKDTLINKYHELEKNSLTNQQLELCFGRLWGGKVLHKKNDIQRDVYKLLNFSNVHYALKGTEIIGMMWSNTLLSSEKYNGDSEGWYTDACKRRDTAIQMLGKDNIDSINLLIFHKLVGTIYMDLGHLQHKDLDSGSQKKTKEQIKEGIEWNYRLLQEWFFS